MENTLSLLHSQSLSVTSYAIAHVTKCKNGQRTEIWILRHHFESQGRQWSMEQLKYSEALCELTASMRHAGKLIRFRER